MTPRDEATPPAAVLARAEQLVVERRRVQVEDLGLCLAWADLHGEPPVVDVAGGDRLVRLGGDGTPGVRDLSLEELSVARQVHVASTRSALADVLDLRHRLPRVWAATQALECESWLARKVARMSRRLSREAVTLVDVAVAAALHQSPGRVIALAEAKIIEADTAAYDAELSAKRTQRGVWLGRLSPTDPDDPDSGRALQTVYARLTPADAQWLDATVNALADRLADDEALRAEEGCLGESASRDDLRAAALGLLARPHDAAEILDAGRTDGAPRHRAIVYVHLHETSLLAQEGVARAEAIGPILVDHLAELLGHAHIDLKPVIDLGVTRSVTGYEHPTPVRERTHLRMAGDVFPHASSTSRRVDADHPVPFDPGGPPGQTGDHNIASLARHHHRAKTHLGYRIEQLGLGRYLWTTPHGLIRLVTPTGTHLVTPDQVDMLRACYLPAA